MNGTSKPGYRQESVRSHNASLMAQAVIGSSNTITRAELVSTTGLNRSTISRVTEQLVEQGIVIELDKSESSGGRPARPLQAAQRTHVAIGAEVTDQAVSARVIDLSGQSLVEVVRRPESRQPEAMIRQLSECLSLLCAQVESASMNLVGIRCGISGVFSSDQTMLIAAPTYGWKGVDLSSFSSLTSPQVPIRFCNSTTLAAAAESHARRRNDADKDFIFLGGTNGIGSALVRNHQIETGFHGWAGELGHVPVANHTHYCNCGSQGCLEQIASPMAIVHSAGFPEGTPLSQLLAGLRRGERDSKRALNAAAEYLGQALAFYINVVDVPMVVLGGGYRPLHPFLLPLLEKQLSNRCLLGRLDQISIQPSSFGESATEFGGAFLCLQDFAKSPEQWMIPEHGWQKPMSQQHINEIFLAED